MLPSSGQNQKFFVSSILQPNLSTKTFSLKKLIFAGFIILKIKTIKNDLTFFNKIQNSLFLVVFTLKKFCCKNFLLYIWSFIFYFQNTVLQFTQFFANLLQKKQQKCDHLLENFTNEKYLKKMPNRYNEFIDYQTFSNLIHHRLTF